jgi:hypothetical protein
LPISSKYRLLRAIFPDRDRAYPCPAIREERGHIFTVCVRAFARLSVRPPPARLTISSCGVHCGIGWFVKARRWARLRKLADGRKAHPPRTTRKETHLPGCGTRRAELLARTELPSLHDHVRSARQTGNHLNVLSVSDREVLKRTRVVTGYGKASGAGWHDRSRPNSGHRSDIAACRRSAITGPLMP